MNQLVTKGIILARTDYGEADRILTILTPEHGKLHLMAKGVRRMKSKLAGGVELFSTADLTYIKGRGGLGRLVSSRLVKFYEHITSDINRTMLGYEVIKQLNKATEDEPEPDYYNLLEQAFVALDDVSVDIELIRMWFSAQILRLGGHTPNLTHAADGSRLKPDVRYEFNFEDTSLVVRPEGVYGVDDIKFLRLVFAGNQPHVLRKVGNASEHVQHTAQLVTHLSQLYMNR